MLTFLTFLTPSFFDFFMFIEPKPSEDGSSQSQSSDAFLIMEAMFIAPLLDVTSQALKVVSRALPKSWFVS